MTGTDGDATAHRPDRVANAGGGDRPDRVAVTGTPGTGKSTATDRLADEYDVIHLNDRIKGNDDLWTERDDERDTLVADLDAVADHLGEWSGVLDSHLAHHFDVDRVVVLRCHPETVESRLRERGESAATAAENAESEALDVVLSEAVAAHGMANVYEVDTTDLEPEAVADAVRDAIEGAVEPSAGTVDFTDYL
ncbi:adenylate kinase family protein [Halorubrum halodurans]|uniref:Putative adenylate kinase n=1 Tax=Halorubrum halodurans TaxID=1383851 RepID=A0A256IJY9_9EURY|nr:adenylate kinase family protein [Halorubrum halodurans]OYR56763.1 adenylate kinase [Halorubrum halodurans]